MIKPVVRILLLLCLLVFPAFAGVGHAFEDQPTGSQHSPFVQQKNHAAASEKWDVTLHIVYKPKDKVERVAKPLRIRIAPPNRADQYGVGSRQAAFGVSMGRVGADQSVGTIVRNAMQAELTYDGYVPADKNADASLSIDVRQFHVETKTTPLYWNIIATVAFDTTLQCRSDHGPQPAHHYAATKKDTTFVWPSASLMEELFRKALADTVRPAVKDIASGCQTSPTSP